MSPLNVSLICVFVQVALTFYVMVRMGVSRVREVRTKEVTVEEIAVENLAYSVRTRLYAKNVTNQFETPVLFFALIGIGAALGAVNWGVAIACVGYIVTRIWHHLIHTGSNRVGRRLRVFILNVLFLAFGWVAMGLSLIGIV